MGYFMINKIGKEIDKLSNMVWVNSPQGTQISCEVATEYWHLHWLVTVFGQEAFRITHGITPEMLKQDDFAELASTIAISNELVEQVVSYVFTNHQLTGLFGLPHDVAQCCFSDKHVKVCIKTDEGTIDFVISLENIDSIKEFDQNEKMLVILKQAWDIISEQYRHETGENLAQDDDWLEI